MTKRSVALAIFDPARPGLVLLVQRPHDDEDLPDVWGLPAATLLPLEDWHDAALRAGHDKLGVQLELGPLLQQGDCLRPRYRLEMRLFRAAISTGIPVVPQPHTDVTQYQALRWAAVSELQIAADYGSLCAQLCLAWHARPSS